MLIFTTNNRTTCVSSFERQHCEKLSHCWTHQTSHWWRTRPSRISPITVQRRQAYDNDFFPYVTKEADSEQPVGAPFYQWVGYRDHAGIICFPHSGSWQAQGGPAYICRDQRKHVFYDMAPLKYTQISVYLVHLAQTNAVQSNSSAVNSKIYIETVDSTVWSFWRMWFVLLLMGIKLLRSDKWTRCKCLPILLQKHSHKHKVSDRNRIWISRVQS